MVLLRRAAQSLSIPFIASGGFADGQGLAAALGLGACGINMGTRFMCTVESPIHINVKRAIVKGDEADTELLLRKWKNTSRLFKNNVTDEAKKIETEQAGSEFKDVAHLVSGQRGKQVYINGDVNYGVSILGWRMLGTWRVPFDFEKLTIFSPLGMDGRTSIRRRPGHSDLCRACEANRNGGSRDNCKAEQDFERKE
jgi:hypothetical protein